MRNHQGSNPEGAPLSKARESTVRGLFRVRETFRVSVGKR